MSEPTTYRTGRPVPVRRGGDTLADILERVLDKGVVIAGDIQVKLLDIELLTLKVRLLIASVDTARDMGIDWWAHDPFLTGRRAEDRQLEDRLARLEQAVAPEQLAEGDRPQELEGQAPQRERHRPAHERERETPP